MLGLYKFSSFTDTINFIESLKTYLFRNKNRNITFLRDNINIYSLNTCDHILKYLNVLFI